MSAPPRILAIAGSDSSGGAGVQADIKTITTLGGYAMTAITAVTAQNTIGVQGIAPMGGEIVARQIASCFDDIGVDAVKIGMLHDADIIEAVASALPEDGPPLVLDPVMVATSGAALIAEDAVEAMRARLFGRAALLTPNLPELQWLMGRDTLPDTDAINAAALELAVETGAAVLAKGGHTNDNRIVDILVRPGGETIRFDHARIDTPHTHGTGCTLSSAIATLLAHGQELPHAVRLARNYVRQAIIAAPGFGQGNGPLGHGQVGRVPERQGKS